MKKFIALALCVVMVAALAACSAPAASTADDTADSGEGAAGGGSVEDIKAAGKLVMLTEAGFPPYEYTGAGGAIEGVDVDIAKAIADELGVELEVVNMDFDGLIAALAGGKGDLVAAGMTVLPEREESVDFSVTYADATQSIIVNKEDPKVSGEEDLSGKTIGVQMGTTGDLMVSEDIEGADVKQYKSGLDASVDLKNGKLDAVVLDKLPAESIVANNDDLDIIEMADTAEQYAIAVKKGNTGLLDIVNKVIGELQDNGELEGMIAEHIIAFTSA